MSGGGRLTHVERLVTSMAACDQRVPLRDQACCDARMSTGAFQRARADLSSSGHEHQRRDQNGEHDQTVQRMTTHG